VQALMCGQMFGIELLVPWMMVGPDVLRVAAFVLMALLMGMLAFTGSYGFFQLLTLALCVAVLDDEILREVVALLPVLPARPLPPPPPLAPSEDPSLPFNFDPAPPVVAPRRPSLRERLGPVADVLSRWSQPLPAHPLGWIATVLSVVWLLVGGVVFWKKIPPTDVLPRRIGAPLELAVNRANAYIKPFRRMHLVNPYGLFADMTTERREVVIEGTLDGHDWQPYEFPYKPGNIDRMPGMAGLYMPRVDWQMWFAALGSCDQNPWLRNLLIRLVQGDPDVRPLFDAVPFDGQTPIAARAVWYDYRFAAGTPGYEQGAWWERKRLGEYCAPERLTAD
jgi:hypothetical protein